MLATSIDVWDPFVCFDRQRILRHQRLDSRVEKTDDGITLSVEMPGVKVTDVTVQAVDHEIRIKGVKRGKEFQRIYDVEKSYDTSNCIASLQDGVLIIKFSKCESSKVRNVEIKTAVT